MSSHTISGKSKVAAGIFAILLGNIGVHKFYVGEMTQGIIYLVFCWTFVPGLLGVVEGIIYLTMSDADFERKMKYNVLELFQK